MKDGNGKSAVDQQVQALLDELQLYGRVATTSADSVSPEELAAQFLQQFETHIASVQFDATEHAAISSFTSINKRTGTVLYLFPLLSSIHG